MQERDILGARYKSRISREQDTGAGYPGNGIQEQDIQGAGNRSRISWEIPRWAKCSILLES